MMLIGHRFWRWRFELSPFFPSEWIDDRCANKLRALINSRFCASYVCLAVCVSKLVLNMDYKQYHLKIKHD